MRKFSFTLNILKEKPLRVVFILIAAILLGSFLFAIFSLSSLATPVVLKFDGIRGITMFGEETNVLGIWIFGFCVVVLNTILSEFFFFRERILSYVFLGTNTLIGVLLFIIISVIVAVN